MGSGISILKESMSRPRYLHTWEGEVIFPEEI